MITIRILVLLLLGLHLACGRSGPAPVVLQQEYWSVINLQGQQETVPAGPLRDPETGQPLAQQVLVIDRQTSQQAWVPVGQLLDQPPVTARYLPLAQPGPDEPGEER